MLIELEIFDFAIIDHLRIEFNNGLSVLTGETGAGKSIIVDALGIALGDRSAATAVRSGARQARIDATFDLSREGDGGEINKLLDALEIEPEAGILVLSREIGANGRSVSRINGRVTSASVLNEIGALLVDIHGQSEHLSLLRSKTQLDMLDHFSLTTGIRQEVKERVDAWRDIRGKLLGLEQSERERAQRMDILQFQASEIDAANLQENEEELLAAELARLSNVSRLHLHMAAVHSLLYEDDNEANFRAQIGALNALRSASKELAESVQLDPGLNELANRFEELALLAADLAVEGREYSDALQADPVKLDQVAERLELIRSLKRKYGDSVTEVVAFGQRASDELLVLQENEESRDSLRSVEQSSLRAILERCAILHDARVTGAKALGAAVNAAIDSLNMSGTEFSVTVQYRNESVFLADGLLDDVDGNHAFDSAGADQVEFLLGQRGSDDARPLARVASGGEISRIMLAIRSVLAEVDATATLIFDEIDVGVGGRSGQAVGQMMSRLADSHQVLTITHLPQIAASADAHFHIHKLQQDGPIRSAITLLSDGERVDEIAAMLDGLPLTDASRSKAIEMLERGGRNVSRK